MELCVGFDAESRTMTFRMEDEGVPFDPLKKPDPDITLSAEEREIGGLGFHYQENNGYRNLCLRKWQKHFNND